MKLIYPTTYQTDSWSHSTNYFQLVPEKKDLKIDAIRKKVHKRPAKLCNLTILAHGWHESDEVIAALGGHEGSI